jgi:hypothetical protein
MRLMLLALVLLSQTPSERQSLAFKEACRAQVYQEARRVVLRDRGRFGGL